MTQDTLAASIIEDWGKLLTGAAAFGGFLLAAFQWMLHRAKTKIIESRESLETQFITMLKEALVAKSERAGHGKTRVIDITFVSPHGRDNEIRLPVILDEWMTVLPGTDIMGDLYTPEHTAYYLRVASTTRIKDHKHKSTESVMVMRGTMRDLTTGRSYYPGEMWAIPAGEIHSVHFEAPADSSSHGLFLVTVRPPLPSTSEVSLNLDGMSMLA